MTRRSKGSPTPVIKMARAPAPVVATVTAGKRQVQFAVRDLSVTGCRLVGPLPLVSGQRARVGLVLDGVRFDLDVEVMQVHSTDLLTDQVDVRFVDPSAAARVAIAAMVNRASEAEQHGPGSAEQHELDVDEQTVTDRLPMSRGELDVDAPTIRVTKKKRPRA